MHIKDAVYSNNHVVPAGYGDGKVPEILKELYDSGFEGFLSLEPHLGSFAGLAELENKLDVGSLPEGGPRQFAIASEALKKIINDIEK